jgi:hypothetical protein
MLMFQAITVKYLGPTNARGARLKAKAQVGSKTVEWRHDLSDVENYKMAAAVLARAFDWAGDWYGGAMPDGGYCFVRFSPFRDDSADNVPAFSLKLRTVEA